MMRFEEEITDRARLRALYREPNARVAAKAIDRIDDICRRFIALSPFVLIATRGADGRLDVSPKGDPAGFVAVLDDRTLAIPDRLGNNRLDSFENLLADPHVGLIFLIPGNGDTLRVTGRGRLVRDADLQARLAIDGRAPELALVVDVEEAMTHCPKALIRSGLWRPEGWPARGAAPSLAEAIIAHAEADLSREEMQEILDRDVATRLY